MNVEQFLDYLKKHPRHRQNIVHLYYQEAQEPITAPLPEDLNPVLVKLLEKEGIKNLYIHQKQVWDYYQKGKNIVITTPTASGKTLAYLLPIFQEKMKNPNYRYLFLYPTKALAQDQLAVIRNWQKGLENNWIIGTYDGDTPAEERKLVKQSGDFILSNPDMLHAGILPQHSQWIKFFENLRTLVIDEMHTYLGIFGSHVALVIRRLKRLLDYYGTKPRFIFSSATIGNPAELAEALTGEPFVVVSESGAGKGAKYFLFYNPPIIDHSGIRQSAYQVTAELGQELVKNDIQTLFFTRSRKRAEMLAFLIKKDLPFFLQNQVDSYRSGYLPSERRLIEKKLKNRELLGVVSTNALEVGIDIGMLQAVISIGYPGRVSSLLQQFGRSGRKKETSLAIFVATSSALDQYIVKNPDFVLKSPGETVLINPKNLLIYQDQLKCAAFELIFKRGDFFGDYVVDEFVEELVRSGNLLERDGFFYWTSNINPAHSVSLRSASQENFVIVDTSQMGNEKVIGEVDYFSAPLFIHEEAIYLHRGKHYFVKKLLWEERKAYVVPVQGDYFTEAEQKIQLFVLTKDEVRQKNFCNFYWGELTVRRRADVFKKIKIPGMENIGYGNIHTPEIEMPTQGAWIEFSVEVSSALQKGNRQAKMTLLANLLKTMSPLIALCDHSDIEVLGYYREPQFGEFSVVFYDNYPGGVGLSYKLVQDLEALLELSLSALELCPCEEGCPSCIGTLEGVNQSLADHEQTNPWENPKEEVHKLLKDILAKVFCVPELRARGRFKF